MHNRKILNLILNSLLILLVISLISVLTSGQLIARPGGGHSYSGGGGGGGGGEGLIYLLFYVLPPEISIPLILGIFIFRFVVERRKNKRSGTVSSSPPISARIKTANRADIELHDLKNQDPNFSEVLFLDFAASIYNKYYSFFGKTEFKNLTPFLSKTEIANSASAKIKQDIREIVIGSINVKEVRDTGNYINIITEIRANYTLFKNNKKSRLAVVELWNFSRKKNVLSLEPDAMRRLTCPSCGGSTDFTDSGVCAHCGNQVQAGEQQWFVQLRRIQSSQIFNTSGLAHYAPETGTSLPTVYQSGLQVSSQQFATRVNIDWNNWQNNFTNEIVPSYFFKIYNAWSENKLDKARNLLSDRVYDSFMFWINAYEKEGMANKLEKVNISDIRVAKVESDKFYDTVTVRIFASALDFVQNKNGKVIGGSQRRPRKFSEYWTFIRRSGVKQDSFDFNKCPSCGAPATGIGQAGVCEYCKSKISSGDFSWVLAIITQDEEYTG